MPQTDPDARGVVARFQLFHDLLEQGDPFGFDKFAPALLLQRLEQLQLGIVALGRAHQPGVLRQVGMFGGARQSQAADARRNGQRHLPWEVQEQADIERLAFILYHARIARTRIVDGVDLRAT